MPARENPSSLAQRNNVSTFACGEVVATKHAALADTGISCFEFHRYRFLMTPLEM
jgi:hypothetical protein